MASSTGSKTWSKKHITALLCWWADQTMRLSHRSALGYPSETVEAKLMVYAGRVDSRPPSSIVPDIPMSPDFVAVDRIMQAMEGMTRAVVHHHYLGSGNTSEKVRQFCTDQDISRATYYNTLETGHEAVRVCLNRDRLECA